MFKNTLTNRWKKIKKFNNNTNLEALVGRSKISILAMFQCYKECKRRWSGKIRSHATFVWCATFLLSFQKLTWKTSPTTEPRWQVLFFLMNIIRTNSSKKHINSSQNRKHKVQIQNDVLLEGLLASHYHLK